MTRYLLPALLAFPLLPASASTFPADLEKGFQQRAKITIEATAKPGRYGTTFFESEKRAYGLAMLAVLGGYEEEGMAYLQSEDADAKRWHQLRGARQ